MEVGGALLKLQILSDLHLESRAYTLVKAPGVDVIVLAGDLAAPSALGRLHNLLLSTGDMPVVVVAGNHDRYHDDFYAPLFTKMVNRFPNVRLLNNSFADIDGVRFVGGTLWSDFSLADDKEAAFVQARNGISDFQLVTIQDGDGYRYIVPADLVADHARCVEAIETHANKRTVVVTHFLPLAQSIDPQFAGSPLNPYFASDCSRTLDRVKPVLAIHGHTHCSCDYMYGPTRIICNPRGYTARENPKFDSQLTVEI